MDNPEILPAVFDGWRGYQRSMIRALLPLYEAQLTLRATPHLRSVEEIARHIVGARAYWFYGLLGEGGEEFEILAG